MLGRLSQEQHQGCAKDFRLHQCAEVSPDDLPIVARNLLNGTCWASGLSPRVTATAMSAGTLDTGVDAPIRAGISQALEANGGRQAMASQEPGIGSYSEEQKDAPSQGMDISLEDGDGLF